MAETRFVTVVLAAVLSIHLFSVGTPVLADDITCPETCNLRQGFCKPSGECRPHELLVKTAGHSLLVMAKSGVSNGEDQGSNRKVEFSCYPGYEGKNCERCAKAPGCLHGTCDQPWQCNCKPGWGGPRCDRELRICQRTQPCKNHATCINDGIGDYLCVCHPSFSGRHCEIYNAGGMSDTKPATEPTATTTKAPTPPPKLCQNDGRCQRYGQNGDCRNCICKPGYAGHFCEENVNECLMRPCSNGGKCFDLSNNFFCECLTGFTGRYCENDVDECALVSGMCYHGGTCKNTFGSYECFCPEGYSGKRCEHVDKRIAPKITQKPLIPRIVSVTAPQRRPTESSTTTTQRPKESPTTAEAKRTPNIVKNPEHEVKMTRITHELKISSVNGEYSASNNELLIRSDVDRNSDAPDSSAKAMQAMTFVFMALAIVILIAILALIYLRCFRNQGNSTNKKTIAVESAVSTVEREISARRGSRYDAGVASTVDETNSDSFEDSDDNASMQIEPCITITNDGHTYNEERESLPACPSPPPPYVLSALDTRRTTSALPLNGYYVALPPVVSSRDSCQNISETSARKSLSTSYGMTSQDSEETTSLLEADSPTLSHKIVV